MCLCESAGLRGILRGMLTKLTLTNFKLFEKAEIELADRVVFVGPNNSGKTTALQALALWNVGVRKWLERRGDGNVPKERAGVTINRRDLIASPIPAANLLWRDLHVRQSFRDEGKQKTRNVLITLGVDGISAGAAWTATLEFDYANEESFYCRSPLSPTGERQEVPPAAGDIRLAYLPPMSGLTPVERRLDDGALQVLIGEGRTAEVLRNLCWKSLQSNEPQWRAIVERMQRLFGVRLLDPEYIAARGEIVMSFRTRGGTELDLSASGRGQQQTLLLLAHMAANPGSVMLLDEPDAHLEVLRQRQMYNELTSAATETGSQIIAASHSEVVLEEAADRDMVVAFVGEPHRIDDRGSQVAKSLKSIGFESYLQAEITGWVLYMEGSTDLAILAAFASLLEHPAAACLEKPFVHYVGNVPAKAREHFHGLRVAKSDLVGIALYDKLESDPPSDPHLAQLTWRKRELENYLCQRDTLLAWAAARGRELYGPLFAATWKSEMEAAISEITAALTTLKEGDPWGSEIKASDQFLTPLFSRFFERLNLPNLMRKTDYHTLARFVARDQIDAEVTEKLDAIVNVAGRARPR
jgi:ABC-type transport system involved in cytochrome c biogenesis ATPase subunit